MQVSIQLPSRLAALVLALFLSLVASGCAIKLVADYDSAAFEEILATGKKVDKFYGTLIETKPEGRRYAAFSEQYVALEADIRGMVTRNQARALNSESTEISGLILKLFVKYKDLHKKNDNYSDGTAKLDRNRLARMFASAASAEEAKKLSADDKDPEKDSK
jgi:uncharacterized protein involved in high-affinity Fe2+ transport